jgi:hypothetical protein
LAVSEAQIIGLHADEVDVAEPAIAALSDDLRFERLDHPDDEVWRFVAECGADRSADHVPVFVARHAAAVTRAVCYVPVEFLTVSSQMRLSALALLPVTDPRLPPSRPWFGLEASTGCVVAVEVDGTSYGQMAERAREYVSRTCAASGSRWEDRPGRLPWRCVS